MIYLISILLLSFPANALERNCETRENLDQTSLNICSYQDELKSEKNLSNVLKAETIKEWRKISYTVCKEVWKPYKKGSIYPLAVSQCKTRMNNFLYRSNKTGMKGGMSDYEKLLQ